MKIHPLVVPFALENTKEWRERGRIRTALEDIISSAQEVMAFTSKEGTTYNIVEADDSMRTLESLVRELFGTKTESVL